MNNYITYQDSRELKSEGLRIDYITINLTNPSSNQELANYLNDLGFNSYQKKSETNQLLQTILMKPQNNYEATFITNIPYWNGIQIHFSGPNANHFYNCIKASRTPIFKDINGVLSRIDLFFDRVPKLDEKVTDEEFLNSFYFEFQSHYPTKKIKIENNQQGLILKIGHRKSPRYSRIYIKDQVLRFELEIKGEFTKDLLQIFLLENRFQEFE